MCAFINTHSLSSLHEKKTENILSYISSKLFRGLSFKNSSFVNVRMLKKYCIENKPKQKRADHNVGSRSILMDERKLFKILKISV